MSASGGAPGSARGGREDAGTAGFERVGVVGQPRYEKLGAVLDRIRGFASEREIDLRLEPELQRLAPDGEPELDPVSERIDLLLTLGGDGTLLRGARLVAGLDVPVLGVNLGHLGFLTAIAEEEIDPRLERIFEGEYVLDHRMTLEARVVRPDGTVDERFLALNDFVVHQRGVARMTRLDLFVGRDDGREEIGSFSGDGVILATPTGSTAYSLSAGGPLIVPSVDCIVVTPIAPHTLAVRPLVIPADEELVVRGLEGTETLVLTVDGQVGRELAADDRLQVRRSDVRIPLVRCPDQSFFTTLRRKLHWAVRSPERERRAPTAGRDGFVARGGEGAETGQLDVPEPSPEP